jgi:hypothetical protein
MHKSSSSAHTKGQGDGLHQLYAAGWNSSCGWWHMCSSPVQVTGHPADFDAQVSAPMQAPPVHPGGGMNMQRISSSVHVGGHGVGLHQLYAAGCHSSCGWWHMCWSAGQVTGHPVNFDAQVSGPIQASPVQSGGGMNMQCVSSSLHVTGHGHELHQLYAAGCHSSCGWWHMYGRSVGQVTGHPVDFGAQVSGPMHASPMQSGGGMNMQYVWFSVHVGGHGVELHQFQATP